MTQMVYLNGALLDITQATVSVLDRGFLFGDGVYEVIPVYGRRPFRLAGHLRRLQQSLDGIRLANPHSVAEWTAIIEQVVAAQTFADQGLYLQITRGPGPRDQAFPAVVQPTVFAMSTPLMPPPAELRASGVSAITAEDIRWARCDLKTTSLVANCLLRQLSADVDASETVLLREGFLVEGAVSSIFIVDRGVIRTPPLSQYMLPGITYDVVLEICVEQGWAHRVAPIMVAELRGAEEIWLTSSSREILPIVMLDGVAVGAGSPGPLYQRIYECYQQFKTREMYAH